jgi:hypothetical protein
MAPPDTLFTHVEVCWTIPAGVTTALYDTVNIYVSSTETQSYALLASVDLEESPGVLRTRYIDTQRTITARDSAHYMVIFSDSTSGAYSDSYLTYKTLTPLEQRLILQLRDYLSRFITNRLADEELRQYIELSLNSINLYSPATGFTVFSLPKQLEPLVITGAVILGVAYNMLGIGFTDISYSDQGFQLTTSRYDKMSGMFDKVLGMYNNLLAVAKLEYAEGPQGVGTVSLPIGLGGNLNRGIMNVFDLLGALGRIFMIGYGLDSISIGML